MTDPNAQSPYEPAAGQPTPPPLTATQDKQSAMWAHLGGAISFLAAFWGWFALLAIVPALVIFLALGKRGALTRQESKEALNFQITTVGAIVVWSIIGGIVNLIVRAAIGFSLVVGGGNLVLLIVVGLLFAVIGWLLVAYDVVFSIVGAVRVNAGQSYRYPFAFRFIK